jgi:hypothetical protein
MTTNTEILGWHFLKTAGVLRDGTAAADSGTAAADSGIETYPGSVKICESGLHASVSPVDALRYNPGGWTLRRVSIVPVEQQQDKMVGSSRRVLWTANAEAVKKVVIEWANWCAASAAASAASAAARAARAAASAAADAADAAWAADAAARAAARAARAAASVADATASAAAGAAEMKRLSDELEVRLLALEPE